MRYALVGVIAGATALPMLSQIRGNRAVAQTPGSDPAAPEQPPKPAGPIFPQTDPNKVVLSVGEQKVTAGEFNTFFSELAPEQQSQVAAHPEARRQLAEQFVDMKLMAGEAKREKLDQTMRFKVNYDQLLTNALMVALMEQKENNRQFFESNKDSFTELKARHILVGVEGSGVSGAKLNDAQAKAKADQIKQRLDKGEDFASAARKDSDDKGSAAQGGSLGTMIRGQMVPEFETAAFGLKDNEISPPIKTKYGYHIIQVTGRLVPTYEQAAQRVPRQRLQDLLEQLKKAEKPEIDDAFFGAPAGAPKADAQKPEPTAPAPAPATAK